MFYTFINVFFVFWSHMFLVCVATCTHRHAHMLVVFRTFISNLLRVNRPHTRCTDRISILISVCHWLSVGVGLRKGDFVRSATACFACNHQVDWKYFRKPPKGFRGTLIVKGHLTTSIGRSFLLMWLCWATVWIDLRDSREVFDGIRYRPWMTWGAVIMIQK